MGRRRKVKLKPKEQLVLGAVIGGILLMAAIAAISPYLLVIIPIILIGIWWYRRRSGRDRRNAMLWVGDMDSMTGTEFEKMLEAVFSTLGYRVSHSGQTGDFGADLILDGPNGRIAVQAKRYTGNVGNKAVQEVYSGMAHYGAREGWVVTNSWFTKAAQTQAKSCGIVLIDRDRLMDMITQARKKVAK